MRVAPALSLALVAGCAAAKPKPSPSPVAAVAAPSPTKAAPTKARVTVEIASATEREGLVRCALHFEGTAARFRVLAFTPLHEARLDKLDVRDAAGPVPVRPSGGRFELGREVAPPIDVHYEVAFGSGGPPDGPFAEPIELRAAGEDVLLLPETEADARVAVDLELLTGGATIGAAASSFGLGIHQQVEVRVSELRHAYFLGGDVGTAYFHTSYGDDFAAWLGPTAFDPRWVSAEAAGLRTAIDVYMGRGPGGAAPPIGLLMTSVKRDEAPVMIAARTRGLFLSADRRAPWTGSSRILLAQALVQRYLGGYLWIGERKTPASGDFFAAGWSRAVARELLYEAGMIDHVERADELNRLLAATTFAEDPHELATARGALQATAVDASLRRASREARSLRELLRELLASAEEKKTDSLPRVDLVSRLPAERGSAFDDEITRGKPVPLPPDLLGRCYRLTAKQLIPFELGFTTSAGEEMTVLAVKARSHADIAGIRAGDVVTDLHYEPGRASVPVVLHVKREERTLVLRFTPAGQGRPGRLFERVSGVSDESCQRP